MSRTRAWARFGVPLVALGVLFAVTKLTTPAEERVAHVSAESPTPPPPGEFPDDDLLARSVRYSDPFTVNQTTRVRVQLAGRGSVHVAFVSEDDAYVREAMGEAPGEIRFAALEPGEWVMRLRALPGGQDLEAEAHTGGQSWTLLAFAAGLLFLPFAWPYRRAPVDTWRRFMSAEH
ncbi:MAG: hypothetical protein ACI9KE_002164 [Polyangiales bacterium]